jgi:hypothetical protein
MTAIRSASSKNAGVELVFPCLGEWVAGVAALSGETPVAPVFWRDLLHAAFIAIQ